MTSAVFFCVDEMMPSIRLMISAFFFLVRDEVEEAKQHIIILAALLWYTTLC